MIDFGKDEIITKETIKKSKRFRKAARKAFSLGLMNIRKNYMGDQRKYMLIHNKKHVRKLLKEGKIEKKLLEDLGIDIP